MKPVSTLSPEEIEFVTHFLGRRSDRDIAKLVKRAEGLIRDLRNSLGIPPKPSGRPVGLIPKDSKVLLCPRCQVVRYITRIKRDGEPVENMCMWCREEVRVGQGEYRHRWAV